LEFEVDQQNNDRDVHELHDRDLLEGPQRFVVLGMMLLKS
jgi:hypothetical protein